MEDKFSWIAVLEIFLGLLLALLFYKLIDQLILKRIISSFNDNFDASDYDDDDGSEE